MGGFPRLTKNSWRRWGWLPYHRCRVLTAAALLRRGRASGHVEEDPAVYLAQERAEHVSEA